MNESKTGLRSIAALFILPSGFYKTKGLRTGYVIMPNHLHVLIGFSNTLQSINKIIGDGKRFMAYEMVKTLKELAETICSINSKMLQAKDKDRNKKHEVWMDSFDWKECRTTEFMDQKLQYIHSNPCSGKWNLAMSPVNYEHSSAGFIPMELADILPLQILLRFRMWI